MENDIITGITYLKNAKKRPSMQEIYNFIKRRNYDITVESFKESFDLLEERGVIVRRNEKDSYFVKINQAPPVESMENNDNARCENK